MELKDKSEVELKAMVFDIQVAISKLQNDMNVVLQELNTRGK
jgi:hypothetical protein